MIRKGKNPTFAVRAPASMKIFVRKVCKIEGLSYPDFIREAVVEKLMTVTKLTREQASLLGWAHVEDIPELSEDVKADALDFLLRSGGKKELSTPNIHDEETLRAMPKALLYRVAERLGVRTPKKLTRKSRRRLVKKILKAQSED